MQILIFMMILGFGLFLHTSIAEENTSVPITLVTDGKPNSTIVVAENSTPSANLAALELQYHIKKITGAVLPVFAFSPDCRHFPVKAPIYPARFV